jgi:hypothetical protein
MKPDPLVGILERLGRLEGLVGKLAHTAGLLNVPDAPAKPASRPVSYTDPIAALRAELARLARQGLRSWPMAIDHVDQTLFLKAQGEYARTVGAKVHPSRSVDGFEAYVLGRDDHVIALEEAA